MHFKFSLKQLFSFLILILLLGCNSFKEVRYENLYTGYEKDIVIKDYIFNEDSLIGKGVSSPIGLATFTEETFLNPGYNKIVYQVVSKSDTSKVLFEESFPAKYFQSKRHLLVIDSTGIHYKRKPFFNHQKWLEKYGIQAR